MHLNRESVAVPPADEPVLQHHTTRSEVRPDTPMDGQEQEGSSGDEDASDDGGGSTNDMDNLIAADADNYCDNSDDDDDVEDDDDDDDGDDGDDNNDDIDYN
jgi:hypothetical protein